MMRGGAAIGYTWLYDSEGVILTLSTPPAAHAAVCDASEREGILALTVVKHDNTDRIIEKSSFSHRRSNTH